MRLIQAGERIRASVCWRGLKSRDGRLTAPLTSGAVDVRLF